MKRSITLQRLKNEERDVEEIPQGWFLEKVEATFVSSEKSRIALQRLKEVLNIVAKIEAKHQWPKTEEWRNILPGWLLKAFRPEYTKVEMEHLLKNKQPRTEWSLADWEYYFGDRIWEWWSGRTEGDKLVIEILVDGHPYSIYELECLLTLCGATSIEVK
jgi:hypothetical protein